MIYLIIGVVVLGFAGTAYLAHLDNKEPCPRELAGWECKGIR